MGEAAALASAFLWSGTSVAMAALSVRLPPLVLGAWRLAAASAIIPVILLFTSASDDFARASWAAIGFMCLSGILANGIGDTIYVGSLSRLGVQRAFTITMTLFITLTVIGGVALLGEELRWLQGVGTLFVAAGIWLLARARTQSAGSPRADWRGYALVVVTAVLWASATLLLAGQRDELGAIAASAIRTPASAIVVIGLAAVVTSPSQLAAPLRDPKQLAVLVVIGALGTAIGSMLYVYGVAEIGAARATVLSATAPLMAMPLSILVLRERFTAAAAIGTVLSVAGIALVVV